MVRHANPCVAIKAFSVCEGARDSLRLGFKFGGRPVSFELWAASEWPWLSIGEGAVIQTKLGVRNRTATGSAPTDTLFHVLHRSADHVRLERSS
jgi:hypothetical protein